MVPPPGDTRAPGAGMRHWARLRHSHSRALFVQRWLRIPQSRTLMVSKLSVASALQPSATPASATTRRAEGASTPSSAPGTRHDRYLAMLRSGTRARTALSSSSASSLAVAAKAVERARERDLASAACSGVVTSVASEREIAGLELWQQGDMELYSAENLTGRMRLRHDGRVVTALHMWWEAASRSAGPGREQAFQMRLDDCTYKRTRTIAASRRQHSRIPATPRHSPRRSSRRQQDPHFAASSKHPLALYHGSFMARVCSQIARVSCVTDAALFRRLYRVILKQYDEADAIASIEEDWTNDSRGADTLDCNMLYDSLFE